MDDDSYTYVQKYNKPDRMGAIGSKLTMWTCSVPSCKAGAFTKKSSEEADVFFNKHTKTGHNHVSNMSRIPKLQAVARAREQAIAQPSTPPRALFATMAAEVSSAGEIVNIKQNTFNRMIERDRVKQASLKAHGFEMCEHMCLQAILSYVHMMIVVWMWINEQYNFQGNRPRAPRTFKEVLELLPEDLKVLLDGTEFLIYSGKVIVESFLNLKSRIIYFLYFLPYCNFLDF